MHRIVAVSLIALIFAALSPATPGVRAAETAPPGEPATIQLGPAEYAVIMKDAPLALYRGGVAGLSPTNPAALGAARLDPSSAASRAYLSYLSGQRSALLSAMSLALGRSVAATFTYSHAIAGFSTTLTGAEAARVASLPNVAFVHRQEHLELLTDNGPKWMDADAVWDGSASGAPTKGEGIVAGIIDTGVNSDHPSFADIGGDGYDHTNPRVVRFGVCAVNLLKCNDKLIGMYDFTGTGEEDDNGHGSHTGSTVAGNVVDATLYAPTITLVPRRISGVAPHANVISYKACTSTVFPVLGSCPLTALLAAIDQATADVVDVINFSIGGGATDPWQDPLGQSFFGTQAAGVFVAASAGNSGPNPQTIGRPSNSPWLMAVAASTHDRRPTGRVHTSSAAGAGPSYTGMSVNAGIAATPLVDAKALGNELCNPFNATQAAAIAGKIVICTQGTIGRVAKGANVKASGGVGMVLVTQAGGKASVVSDTHVVPTVMISEWDGAALRTWLAGATAPMATIDATVFEESASLADRLAYFSSRGPDPTNLNVIKPDVTAPGVAIWAAFSSHSGPPGTAEYNIIQGTSMSSPHAAGAAALVRAARPTWTPDQVKSALMSTAFTTPRGGRETVPVTKEDHTTPADPFDVGGGRIDVARAVRAGLVLNETVANYQAANPALGGDAKTLNLASLANPNCGASCVWTRTVTSAASARVSWSATATAPAGATITVSPATFTLDPGQSQTITVTATTSSTLAPGAWHFGSVTLAKRVTSIPTGPDVPEQRFPVAIRVPAGDVPPPCTIAEGVRTDPVEINVAPAHNITEVATSGLYPTFAGSSMPNIVFRMKVSSLDPLPPDSHWRIAFQTPGQAANLSWFVQMLRGATGEPTFVYGSLDSAAGQFTTLGAPEAGSWSPDGTIKITIAASKVGSPTTGDTLTNITGAAGAAVPGAVTTNADSTTNGSGPTAYTLQACADSGPFAQDDEASTTINVPVVISVLANDSHPNGQEINVTSVTAPANGTATRNANNTITYTPAAGFTGVDGFSYTISDPAGRTDSANVRVTVAPRCPTTSASYDFGSAAGWTVQTAAPGDGVLHWAVRTDVLARSGMSSMSSDAPSGNKDDRLIGPAVDLTALSRVSFWHRFGFEDGFDGGVLEASIDGGATWKDVTALGGIFLKGAYNGDISAADGSAIAGRRAWTGSQASAVHGSMAEVVVDVGALAGNGRLFRWRLVTDALIPDFGWWVDDVTFSGLATSCNEPPVANDDAATTQETRPVTIAVLANDTDADGDALTLTGVTQPANGTATANADGTVTYAPATNFSGTDTFTYSISDGHGGTATGNVTVTVGRPGAPVACFTYHPRKPNKNTNIKFEATCSKDDRTPRDSLVFEWDFTSDGVIDATGIRVKHKYGISGTFTVTLRVTDADGNTDSVRRDVFVKHDDDDIDDDGPEYGGDDDGGDD